MGNFYFFIFIRLTWEFLDFESECGGSVYWPNNKIIDSSSQSKSKILNIYILPFIFACTCVSPMCLRALGKTSTEG